jgi:putative transcriptional regulator
MSKADERILQSIAEARRFVRAEATEGFVVHEFKNGEAPPTSDVRAIRDRLGLSQAEFAHRFGFGLATVRNWEQGRRVPHGPARILLKVIEREPDAVARALSG